MVKRFFFILLFVISQQLSAQVDTEFWFGAPDIGHGDLTRRFDLPIVMRLVAFNSSANVTISQPANPNFTPINVTIPAHAVSTVDLSAWVDSIETKPANTVKNFGIRIVSNVPITAYYEVTSTNCGCNPEIFVLKGRNALGTDFIIATQTYQPNAPGIIAQTFNSIVIVATLDNTLVEITPSKNVVGHLANVKYSVLLNKGQTFVVQATSHVNTSHLAGTLVTSNKPIAITESDDALGGSNYGGCSDLTGDQLVPVNIFGEEFIAMGGRLYAPYDKAFILASQNNTDVYQNGVWRGTINKGQTMQLEVPDSATYFKATKPVNVTQLSGIGCEFGSAVLPPIVCTGSFEAGFVRSSNETLAVNLLVYKGGQNGFKINGASGIIQATDFKVVPNTNGNWMTARYLLNKTTYPANKGVFITNDSVPFHLGVLQGDLGSGARFGYFSNYNKYRAKVKISEPNPCINTSIILSPDTVLRAVHKWTGPQFTSTIPVNSLSPVTKQMEGWYKLKISITGCESPEDSMQLMVHEPNYTSVTAIANDSFVCKGMNVQLGADSIGYGEYSWKGPNGFTSTQRNPLLLNASFADSGLYIVTAKALGCAPVKDSIYINVYSEYSSVTASVSQQLSCLGATLQLNADTIKNATYNWTGPNGFVSSMRSPQRANMSLADTGYYYVTMQKDGCPSVKDSVKIRVFDKSSVNLDIHQCYGTVYTFPSGRSSDKPVIDTSRLISQAGCDSTVIINLHFDSELITNINDSVCEGGIYTLPDGSTTQEIGTYTKVLTSVKGCDSTIIINLAKYKPISYSKRIVSVSCDGRNDGIIEITSLNGNNPFKININGMLQSTLNDGLKPGKYLLEIEDARQCKISEEITITEPEPLMVRGVPGDTTILLGKTIKLQAFSNHPDALFIWTPDIYLSCDSCPSPTAEPKKNTEYKLSAYRISENGMCVIDTPVIIRVVNQPEFFVPNVISSNEDGVNDKFTIKGIYLDLITSFNLVIVDRWGEIIYKTNALDFEWNATFKGSRVQSDVYSYRIEYKTLLDTSIIQTLTGTVTVLD